MSDTGRTLPNTDTEPAPATAQGFTPVVTRTFKGQRQDLYHFENGFGASVLHCNGAPGSSLVWHDLVVIRWEGPTFHVVFDSPVTYGLRVLDSLAEPEVHEALAEIKALPAVAPHAQV